MTNSPVFSIFATVSLRLPSLRLPIPRATNAGSDPNTLKKLKRSGVQCTALGQSSHPGDRPGNNHVSQKSIAAQFEKSLRSQFPLSVLGTFRGTVQSTIQVWLPFSLRNEQISLILLGNTQRARPDSINHSNRGSSSRIRECSRNFPFSISAFASFVEAAVLLSCTALRTSCG